MNKELHIWIDSNYPKETIHDYATVYSAIVINKNEIVHTTNTHFCKTTFMVDGYKLFLHLLDNNCVEVTFGSKNNGDSSREIREGLNLENLLLGNEFGKTVR